MAEEFARLAVGVSAAAAIGSLAIAIMTLLRARRQNYLAVKLTNGTAVYFDDTMTPQQVEQSLKDISGSVRSTLHPAE